MAERSGDSGVTHTELAGIGCGATMNSRWSPECRLPGEGKDRFYGRHEGAKRTFDMPLAKVNSEQDSRPGFAAKTQKGPR